MKKHIIRNIGRLVLLLGLVLTFSRCETDLNGMDQEETNATVTIRGGNPGLNIADLCPILENNYPKEALTSDEEEALLFMREEEKLARDVYLGLRKKWNLPIFDNISQAEQRHMDVVGCLIEKYGLKDPVDNNGEGVFKNETLKTLYTSLLTDGSPNLIATLKAGAKVEDLDLYDLERLATRIDNQDIKLVFGDLAKGSRNHLRAFIKTLERQGGSYTPLYLSPEAFNVIVSGEHETCGIVCDGTCLRCGGRMGRNFQRLDGVGFAPRNGTGQQIRRGRS